MTEICLKQRLKQQSRILLAAHVSRTNETQNSFDKLPVDSVVINFTSAFPEKVFFFTLVNFPWISDFLFHASYIRKSVP